MKFCLDPFCNRTALEIISTQNTIVNRNRIAKLLLFSLFALNVNNLSVCVLFCPRRFPEPNSFIYNLSTNSFTGSDIRFYSFSLARSWWMFHARNWSHEERFFFSSVTMQWENKDRISISSFPRARCLSGCRKCLKSNWILKSIAYCLRLFRIPYTLTKLQRWVLLLPPSPSRTRQDSFNRYQKSAQNRL